MGDTRKFPGVNCFSFNAPQFVKMNATGKLRICRGSGDEFNDCGCREEGPRCLPMVKQVTRWPLPARSLCSGMKCTVWLIQGEAF